MPICSLLPVQLCLDVLIPRSRQASDGSLILREPRLPRNGLRLWGSLQVSYQTSKYHTRCGLFGYKTELVSSSIGAETQRAPIHVLIQYHGARWSHVSGHTYGERRSLFLTGVKCFTLDMCYEDAYK